MHVNIVQDEKSDKQTYQKSPKVSKQRILEFIDISSMTYPSAGGKKHWLLIVDEATDYAHSLFLKKKNDMIETMLMWVKNLFMKQHIRIKKIRLDNSGENRMFQTKPDQQNMGIKFEFTAPGTPQQNSVVERKFPTLMGRARAMMNHAGFDDNFNKKFWCEAISAATKLDNIMVRQMGGKPPYYIFCKEHPKYRKYLRILGEVAVVAKHERKSTRPKIDQRGNIAMFVGHTDDHSGDVYRFIHVKTQHVILSRDARWMNIMWKAYMRKQQYISQGLQTIDEDFESDDDDETQGKWINQQTEHRDRRSSTNRSTEKIGLGY